MHERRYPLVVAAVTPSDCEFSCSYLFVRATLRQFPCRISRYFGADPEGPVLFFFFFVFLKEEITFDSRSRNYFVSLMLSFLLFQRVYTICIDGEYRFLFSFEYQVISYTYILFIEIKRNIGTKEPLQNNLLSI